jgi:hypothetical protein
LHGAAISEFLEKGLSETGKGVAGAVRGIGRFFGGIFGKNESEAESQKR